MNTTEALRWLGPEVAQALLDAERPYDYAWEKCEAHHAKGDHHLPAWEAVQHHMCEQGKSIELFYELHETPESWRDVIQDDPIPPWALRAALEEAGWTYEDLADRIRSSRRAVQEWADGKRRCTGPASVAVIHAIHKSVGCA